MDRQIFNPLIPGEYLAILGIVFVGTIGWLAWRNAKHGSRGKRLVLTGLRVTAALLLTLLAANPGEWHRTDLDRQDVAVVLADRSASMSVADVDGKPRWQVARQLANRLAALDSAEFPVVVLPFSERLEDAWHADLAPDGTATDIVGAGRAILDRYRGGTRRLAGMLVIGDGRQTGARRAGELAERARAMDCPVSALTLGSEVREPDLALRMERHRHIVLPGQNLSVAFTVAKQNLPAIRPRIRLLAAQGVEKAFLQPQLDEDGEQVLRFELTGITAGYHLFRIETPVWEGERRTDNNVIEFAVLAPERPMRVFVAEGAPSWDTKFFLQLLRTLPFVQAVSVSRVTGDRFFEVSDGDEKNAQPVGMEGGGAIFPDSRSEMAHYDLIVIGKGIEFFMTPPRLERLADYVREQGGSILFFRGRPNRVPMPEIEALEPVRWTESAPRAARLRPTRAGEDVGLFGDTLPGAADPLWKELPSVHSARARAVLKDFSIALMNAESEDLAHTEPALVVRRFGKGQVLTMNADGLWQWSFFPVTEQAKEIYATLWAQILQWTVSVSDFLPGQPWSLRVGLSTIGEGDAIHATVSTRLAENAGKNVLLRLIRDDQSVADRLLNMPSGPLPSAGASFVPDTPGVYHLELFDEQGLHSLGPRQMVAIHAAPDENATYSADPAFLQELTSLSDGRMFDASNMETWLENLKQRRADTGESQTHRTRWQPRWNQWPMLAAIAALLCLEWFIRKRSGWL